MPPPDLSRVGAVAKVCGGRRTRFDGVWRMESVPGSGGRRWGVVYGRNGVEGRDGLSLPIRGKKIGKPVANRPLVLSLLTKTSFSHYLGSCMHYRRQYSFCTSVSTDCHYRFHPLSHSIPYPWPAARRGHESRPRRHQGRCVATCRMWRGAWRIGRVLGTGGPTLGRGIREKLGRGTDRRPVSEWGWPGPSLGTKRVGEGTRRACDLVSAR